MEQVNRSIRASLLSVVLLLLTAFSISLPAQAAYLRNVPQTLTQPNGEQFECFASGDENCNWLHDAEGFVIIQNPETGYYSYAAKTNGQITATPYIVGKVNPESIGLEPDIRVAPEVIEQKRQARSLSAQGIDGPSNAPRTGTVNNLVIFIRFSDDTEYTDSFSIYDNMFNSSTAGANSMKNYFKEVSYDQLTINTACYPDRPGTTVVSYQDTQPRNYYRPYNATTNPIGYQNDTESTNREFALLKRATEAVAPQIPTSLNLDGDNDGQVDNVCYIIKGSPDGWSDLLWPHMWALYLSQYATYINGKQVYIFNFQLQNSLMSSGVGVLCHEMFHSLGAPDLYHYSQDGMTPVGRWDLMEWNTNPPQHMTMYMKKRYGTWVTTIPEITTSGTYTLNPVTSATNNCYKIASPNSTTQYFLVEYRRKTGAFENSIPGSGLIVYRINTAIDGQGNRNGPPDEVYVYRPNGTTTIDGQHLSANFSAETGRTAINDTTNPSSFLSNGAAGGLNISQIGSAGTTISFQVTIGTLPKVATPTFTPDGGSFTTSQNVVVSCATSGATIHYTTNGTDPTEASPTVASGGTIPVSQSLTLKARAWKSGMDPSDIKSASYTIGTVINRIYVNRNAPGPVYNGASWATAFQTIKAAVNAATSGKEIWVAAGTYQENTIILKDGVSLYGGFAGNETELSERNWVINKTILDGNWTDYILWAPGTVTSGRLDGFVIIHGSTEVGGALDTRGTMTIVNNVFDNNQALYGGGIYAEGSPTIANNIFKDNYANLGFAICGNQTVTAKIIGNTIVGNTGPTSGDGGIYLEYCNSTVLKNNIVAFNYMGVFPNGGSMTWGCNCYYGNTVYNYYNFTPYTSDIQSDPRLTNRGGGDYRLQAISPCIDKGDNAVVQMGWLDMDMRPRIIGTKVDIGAYEHLAPTGYATTGQAIKFGQWNLVSVPADPVNPDPLFVFSAINVPNASFQFWKNNVDSGGWQSYGSTFGWTGPIVRGTPYWFLEVGTGSNKDIGFMGYPPLTDFEINIPAHTNAPYWIMFGTPFPSPVLGANIRFKNVSKRGDVWLTWAEAFSESNPTLRIVESAAQGWDATANNFVNVTSPPWTAPKMQFDPWWGYWLLVSDPGALKIKFPKP